MIIFPTVLTDLSVLENKCFYCHGRQNSLFVTQPNFVLFKTLGSSALEDEGTTF
jgi:hypothetical protein